MGTQREQDPHMRESRLRRHRKDGRVCAKRSHESRKAGDWKRVNV